MKLRLSSRSLCLLVISVVLLITQVGQLNTFAAAPPLNIACPGDLVVWTCGTNKIVTYPPPRISGGCSTDVTVTCTPPSRSSFGLGTTTVTCRAVDTCINRDACTFTVTVKKDTTPPVIVCPTDLTVWTCSTDGAAAIYLAPVVTDDHDTTPAVTCQIAVRKFFSLGDHHGDL